jgi:Fur family ferric uptake transcriptional regulator
MPYQTETRKKLVAFLREHAQEAMTADEVAQGIGGISQSTVYRNLNLLCENGEVLKSVQTDGHTVLWQWHEKQACEGHLHLRCESCGRVIHLDQSLSRALSSEINASSKFEVDMRGAEIPGLCAKCRK